VEREDELRRTEHPADTPRLKFPRVFSRAARQKVYYCELLADRIARCRADIPGSTHDNGLQKRRGTGGLKTANRRKKGR